MTTYSKEKYAALSEEDKTLIDDMLEVAIAALSTGQGAAIMLVDVNGLGVAQMLAVGNQLLIEPLLRSADAVCAKVFSNHTGVLQ
jgi:hypothetical protein